MKPNTDYEAFEAVNRRLLRQEELILDVTEALEEALARGKVNRAQLAARLGKSKGFVTQALSGRRNLTLRTVADIADALGCRIQVKACRESEAVRLVARVAQQVVPYDLGRARSGAWGKLVKGRFGRPGTKDNAA